MGYIGLFLPGTRVKFLYGKELTTGTVIQFFEGHKLYQVIANDVNYYVKPEEIIECLTETESQDNSLMTQNHQTLPSPEEKQPASCTTNNEEQLELLRKALSGERGTQQQIIAEEGMKIVTLLLRKNHDYGSSVFEPPALDSSLSVLSAIDVRMSDKIARIRNLKKAAAEVKAETVDDTYRDLGGYCILRCAVQRYNDEVEF